MQIDTVRGSTQGFQVRRNVQLARCNTFRVAARASLLADVWDSAALPRLLSLPEVQEKPLVVLGGGSNILFTKDFKGLIVHLSTHGRELVANDPEWALVRVAAGEDWDGFVRWSLLHGFTGLENLILIPGSVGAAPIQNIGAYGVEVSEFVSGVTGWDRHTGQFVQLNNEDCAFGYRRSLFKSHPERYIVTTVEFRLPRNRPPRLDYAGIRRELAAMGVASAAPDHVARAVENIRRRKLPDPAMVGNTGSFFKNPVVTLEHVQTLRLENPDMPVYPQRDDCCKLSAAWLIEACGFKGLREGDAGVSDKHALVLVNHGTASGSQVWALAQKIRHTVAARFGITLEPEPLVL